MAERTASIGGHHTKRQLPSSGVAKTKQFKLAIQERRVEDVKALLENNDVDPNKRLHGMTPLNMAVYSNNVDVVKLLLEHNARVDEHSVCADSEEGEHEYPVVTAARLCRSHSRQSDIIRLLISYNADLNKTDFARLSPLYYAVHHRNIAVTKMLLENGADVNMLLGKHGRPVMFESVIQNDVHLLELLLEWGSQSSVQDCSGFTPLHFAMDNGLDVAELLISQGISINPFTNTLVSPLHSALMRGQFKTARLLLAHGAYPNVFSSRSGTPSPLSLVLSAGDLDLAALIASAGCDLNKEHASTQDGTLVHSGNTRLDALLNERVLNPAQLKELCRIEIRTYCCQLARGRSILKHCEQLPLPKLLINYVCFY